MDEEGFSGSCRSSDAIRYILASLRPNGMANG